MTSIDDLNSAAGCGCEKEKVNRVPYYHLLSPLIISDSAESRESVLFKDTIAEHMFSDLGCIRHAFL